MKLRHTLSAAAAGLALAGASLLLSPASAVSGSSPVQLTVTSGGGLAISAPQPTGGATHIDLGSVGAGAVLAQTNNLGTVTVTDTRTGVLNNNWIASVSASNLVLNGDPANDNVVGSFIPAASIGYVTGTVNLDVAPTVPPVVVPTLPSLAVAAPVVTSVSLGANTLSWSPKLAVTVLPNTQAGVYKGTVTHSAL